MICGHTQHFFIEIWKNKCSPSTSFCREQASPLWLHNHFFCNIHLLDSKHRLCSHIVTFLWAMLSATSLTASIAFVATLHIFKENPCADKYKKLVGVRVSGGDLCEAEAPTEATAETTPNPLNGNRQYCRRNRIMKKPLCDINTTAIFILILKFLQSLPRIFLILQTLDYELNFQK